MTWRHDVIVTCNAITDAIGHRNNNPNVNQGFHHTVKSLEHLTNMLQKCHDVMTWRHDVIVTCKTISGTNQHINLIPNLFPGFYYMGRSLGHFTTCCRQPLTSWHDVMTSSWHVKLEVEIASVRAFHVMLTSCRHVMASGVDSNMLYSGPMTYPCSRAPE